MELYFLTHTFAMCSAPVDTAVSVVWSPRFHECGTFSVHLPPTEGSGGEGADFLTLAAGAAYICDRTFCGRIESLACRDNMLEVGGRLLECLLYDRVSGGEYTWTGTPAEAALAAVRTLAGDMTLVLPESLPPLDKTGTWTMEKGTNLGSWMHRILSPYGCSYTVSLNGAGEPVLEIVRGTDRSLDSDDGTSRAIFSEEFGNIASLEMERYREELINRVYVEGSDGTVVTVDRSEETAGRREGFAKASDIRPADFASREAYTDALEARGEAFLAENGEVLRLACVAESDALPRYGEDYRLGDICEIRADTLHLRLAARLTAMDVVHEGGTKKLYPAFGDEIVRVRNMWKTV